MYPSVTGFLCDPSIVITLPCGTVTARLQASGKSSGHAVSITDAGPPRIGSRGGASNFPGSCAIDNYDNISRPEPRTQNPEPRTQNPEPRTQNENAERRTPNARCASSSSVEV